MTRFDGAVEPIAVATRSGLDESVHHGAGVALGADGALRARVGEPDLVVYPRSCLKPLQADAMLALGLELPDELVAVACASHDGSPGHLAAVRAILERYDLAEPDLQNTPSRPDEPGARSAARAAGIEPSSLQQNCSGKHAAMLATCRVNGWTIDDYLRPEHPLQQAIVEHIGSLGAHVHHVGVDGCGAPTHALSLTGLARAIASVARSGSTVARSMTEHPEMVGGPGRDVTLWMQAIPSLVAKEGAAGVMTAALPDGRAVAFKIADGSDVARRAVTPAALRAVGIDVDGVAPGTVERLAVAVLGHGRPVGRISPVEWMSCSS